MKRLLIALSVLCALLTGLAACDTAEPAETPADTAAETTAVLGFALLERLDYNQQNTLGGWLMLIGQILCSNAAQGQLLESRQDTEDRRLEQLEQALAALQRQLDGSHGSTEPTVAADSGWADSTT